MPDQSRKCKMISLRLTAEEYDAMHTLYSRYGVRNVSEFARLAMQRAIGQAPLSDGAVVDKIQNLDERLSAVEGRIALLADYERQWQSVCSVATVSGGE